MVHYEGYLLGNTKLRPVLRHLLIGPSFLVGRSFHAPWVAPSLLTARRTYLD